MSTPPLLLVTAPLPSLPESELISTCRKLILNDGDWVFMTSDTEFLALQLNSHSQPVSATQSLINETFDTISSKTVTPVDPSLGFVQRSGQTIPITTQTTVVRYKTSPGGRGAVLDACVNLFAYAEKEEMDVYSLAIMNLVESEDEFIIFERYADKEAEQRHLASPRCVECLTVIKGRIIGHDSRSYKVLDI